MHGSRKSPIQPWNATYHISIINHRQCWAKLTKQRVFWWGSLLLLPRAPVRSLCSAAAGCVLQLHNKRQPTGTTRAAPPGHRTSCTQTSYSPASGRDRDRGGKGHREQKRLGRNSDMMWNTEYYNNNNIQEKENLSLEIVERMRWAKNKKSVMVNLE